jgi:hypothetical protein
MPRNLFLPALLFILFGDFGNFLIHGNQRSPVLAKFPSEFADIRSRAQSNPLPSASNDRMLKRVSLIVLGWTFLLLGAAGIILPVLPGLLFLLIGLSILSVEYEWAKRWVDAIRNRFPAADRKLQGMLDKVAKPTSA